MIGGYRGRRWAASWLRFRTQWLLRKGRNAGQYAVSFPSARLVGVDIDCTRDGLSWRLAPADLAQRLMFAVGSYEKPLVDWLAHELEPGDLIVDCGAHVGLLTVPLAHRLRHHGSGRVVAFEPAPDSVARLAYHLELNGLTEWVEVVAAALGEARSRAVLTSPTAADDPSQRMLGRASTGGGSVEVMSFDEWWTTAGEPYVSVVKIDVEGGELAVLRGMRKLLGTAPPRLVVVELKPELSATAGTTVAQAEDLLRGCGYRREPPLSQILGGRRMPHIDANAIFRLDVGGSP